MKRVAKCRLNGSDGIAAQNGGSLKWTNRHSPASRLCREEQGNRPENLAAHPDTATKETPRLHGAQAAAQAPSTATEEAFCCCLNTFKNT
ncbi:histidinol phosphate phosphatase [Neisseria bergeri]|uniref:histidinol phosphate phosphatase n=1 Tax=Neisseria bergeri TaxID=1906581 RepID=UPI001EFC8201|nr:histidinol phosphate phosphatase [Neisseria bergeri]